MAARRGELHQGTRAAPAERGELRRLRYRSRARCVGAADLGTSRPFLRTLPLGLRGSASTKSTLVGHLNLASRSPAVGDDLLRRVGSVRAP